jgi:hypothetical protein
MISEKEREELKKIYHNYSVFHSEIKQLNQELEILLSRQSLLHQHLNSARETEKLIINNLEERINRKITHEDLLQIVSE